MLIKERTNYLKILESYNLTKTEKTLLKKIFMFL